MSASAGNDDPIFRDQLDSALVGLRLKSVETYAPDSPDWRFIFEDGTRVDASCPWRILKDREIALGRGDHNQKFGLPQPLDGRETALRLLSGTITKVTIDEVTSDLFLEFDQDTQLELFNSSSGYEGWECLCKSGLHLVAQGGGNLAYWLGP
jgi:hypothetical protein